MEQTICARCPSLRKYIYLCKLSGVSIVGVKENFAVNLAIHIILYLEVIEQRKFKFHSIHEFTNTSNT